MSQLRVEMELRDINGNEPQQINGYITVPDHLIPKPAAQPNKLMKYLIWLACVLIFFWGINIGMLVTQAVMR